MRLDGNDLLFFISSRKNDVMRVNMFFRVNMIDMLWLLGVFCGFC